MNGTNFRNEYKNAMEELTPSSELLNRISGYMEQANAEPIQQPPQNKSFFSKHRAILTAAATFAIVIGIFAVGIIVVSHFNNMNNMSSGSAFDGAGNAASIADEEDFVPEDFGPVDENEMIIGDAVNNAPSFPTASPGVTNKTENENSVYNDGYYSNSLICELAEKAKNGTLTIDDIGKNITIQGDDEYCQVFCSFKRNLVSYTIIAEFKSTDGELRVMNLYITETEQADFSRQINLIKNSEYLEDYFAGNYSQDVD